MVAVGLPDAVQAVFEEVHRRALACSAAAAPAEGLFAQAYRPHVSVIYGVTDDNAAPAWRALQAYLDHRPRPELSFGNLKYWDDAVGQKTTLVAAICDADDVLTALHGRIAEAAHIASRYAYHPHVTIAYLPLGQRFDTRQEYDLRAPLQATAWQGASFYMTDPCGVVQLQTELGAAQ